MTPTTRMTVENLTDSELVRATLKGDRNAFGQIVERYQNLICSLAYSVTGDVAHSQDLAQETFLIAWKRLARLRDPDSLRSWLCGIAKNRLRKSRRHREHEPVAGAQPLEAASACLSSEASPITYAMSREEEAVVWRTLEKLPENCRQVLVLFYRKNQSVQSVATALNLSGDAVKQRLCRGRRLLRQKVVALIGLTLERTVPGDGFTAAVLAALPSPIPSKLGQFALATFKTMFAPWLALLGILVGGWIGWKAEIDSARSRRERQFLLRKTWALCGVIGIVILGNTLGWWAVAANWVGQFGDGAVLIGLLFGIAAVFVAQQGYLLSRQHRIQRQDGTFESPDPLTLGPKWWVVPHVVKRMAGLLVAVLLISAQAAAEHQWHAAVVGFALVPGFVALGVRRWHAYQRDKAGTVFRGMLQTVIGFFCLTLLAYDWPRWAFQGEPFSALLPINLGVTVLYTALLAVVLLNRSRLDWRG
jgi:RNA polymerase sigma factor (sigma-70 family)